MPPSPWSTTSPVSKLHKESDHQRTTNYNLGDVVYSDINEDNPLGMQGYVAVEFSKLIRRAWTAADYSTLTPTQFKATIGKFRPQFHGTQQHDSQVFLFLKKIKLKKSAFI